MRTPTMTGGSRSRSSTWYTKRHLVAGTGFRAQHFQQMSTQEQQAVLQKRFKQMDHANKGYLDRNDWTAS